MRTVFFGTPESAVPFLDFLCHHGQTIAVVTRVDKPSSRGQKVQNPPVKLFAEKKGSLVLQPSSLKEGNFLSQLSSLEPEVGIVVAYGKILPKEVIEIFPKGIFNIHFSLLPELRGGAPIQWAIWRGKEKTGVTSFRISESLDTGRILVQKSISISPQENAITLEEKLISLGILTLEETIIKIESGTAIEKEQVGEPSFAPLIKKEDTRIDWRRSAEEIARQLRALIRLGTFSYLPSGKVFKILQAEPQNSSDLLSTPLSKNVTSELLPGTLCGIDRGHGFLVKCGSGILRVSQVQVEGKREMDAWSFLQGSRLKVGERLVSSMVIDH